MISIDLKNIESAPNDWSEVFDYREDLNILKKNLEDIKDKYKNVLVIGNGGSITSFEAMFWALCSDKDAKTVWTMDPFYLKRIKRDFKKEDTIVIAVSKSGNTLGQLESLMYFKDYDVVVVTEKERGALSEIAQKLDWKIIEHPPIGGRFSAGTSSTLTSAYMAGMDIVNIQKGIISGYKLLKNEAFSLSKYYFDKEKNGYEEVYVSIYSEALEKFQNLIIQLMHESVCKDGKGQTFYTAMGPESQHHTNQRFLGGKKNVIGTFIISGSENDESVSIPEEISDINYKGVRLSDFNKMKYSLALSAEYLGTKQDADKLEVPNVTIKIEKIDEESIGELISFWQMVAFYSSILRGVNPFDQPAVENSKNITLQIIKENL